tara:strand:+ start:247 stop:378 length:132 start_codon:yes stop_codon:yes gene_type:complete
MWLVLGTGVEPEQQTGTPSTGADPRKKAAVSCYGMTITDPILG